MRLRTGTRIAVEADAVTSIMPIAPLETWPALPHVLVLMPDGPGRTQLVRDIAAAARISILDRASSIPELAPVDIALLHVDHVVQACGPLLCDPRLGSPEIVFVVDQAGSPQHLALKSRGFQYVASQDVLSQWLPTVLTQLSSVARARRIVLDACTEGPMAPELPALKVNRQTHALRLREAEATFRAVFLRSLLAECGSRRKAADTAGVPYRSFCHMLRKLGI